MRRYIRALLNTASHVRLTDGEIDLDRGLVPVAGVPRPKEKCAWPLFATAKSCIANVRSAFSNLRQWLAMLPEI